MTGEEENWTLADWHQDCPGSGGAIELYNCPDQETNDPESVRSWAIFKLGELKHTSSSRKRPHHFHSCAAVITHQLWIFVFHDWVDVGLNVTSYQTRFDKHETTWARETREKFRSIIVMTRSSSLKSFILGWWEQVSMTVSEPRRSV